MVDVVDAVIAEYANEQEPAEVAPEPEVVEPKEPEPTEEASEPEATEEEKSKEELDPWPKPAKNAISRLKQSNARKNAEISMLKEKIAQFESLRKSELPKEENFKDWDEYQDAKTEHRLNIKLAQTQVEEIQNRVQAYEAEEDSARISEVNEIGEVFAREHPAAAKLIADNMQVIAALPPHVKKALQMADNPPLALHNLIKEGNLEYLAHLPLEKAAIEIGKAESKQMAPKPQTKAPEPMKAARANVNPGFNYQSMSPSELLKTIRKG